MSRMGVFGRDDTKYCKLYLQKPLSLIPFSSCYQTKVGFVCPSSPIGKFGKQRLVGKGKTSLLKGCTIWEVGNSLAPGSTFSQNSKPVCSPKY